MSDTGDDPIPGWLAELCDALDVPVAAVDRELLLDLARDAAHGVARPAAPLTAFVVGWAAARSGGDAAAVQQAVQVAQAALEARAS